MLQDKTPSRECVAGVNTECGQGLVFIGSRPRADQTGSYSKYMGSYLYYHEEEAATGDVTSQH